MAELILNYLNDNNDNYSDGDIEEKLLRIFSSKKSKESVNDILSNNPNWAMYYHLSLARENILSWYNFRKEANLLEIGAGCGALTGLFCNKLKSVTAVELSERRSKIINFRHKKFNNLKIYAGNLNDIKIEEKFDYITLIGVLEYAGKYTHTKNPFIDFLKSVKRFLKEDGLLILAIENKFGLKYWAGAREDHTGKFFDSIENYPSKEGIETFGKEEMMGILMGAGFKKFKFHYPMPDYKFPTELFSDDYLPTFNHNLRSGMFPVRDLSNEREIIFDERLAMDNIIKNNQFSFFANSFLIFVS